MDVMEIKFSTESIVNFFLLLPHEETRISKWQKCQVVRSTFSREVFRGKNKFLNESSENKWLKSKQFELTNRIYRSRKISIATENVVVSGARWNKHAFNYLQKYFWKFIDNIFYSPVSLLQLTITAI